MKRGLFVGALLAAAGAWAELPPVLSEQADGFPPKEMMRRYWLERVRRASEACDAARAALTTREQATAYQARIRQSFAMALGGFPERTPLNPAVAGVVKRDGYRIEKVLFESEPQHVVTALFFVPESKGRVPGVLVPCGHSATGKESDVYQRACLQLVKSGIAALIYDPIDQGERMQLLDEKGKPVVGGTAAHSRVGVGSILLGRGTATFRIWDGMRALDYLASRPEVDAERLGCTGNSGGGTLTSYLMALDPRIKAAAPSCYITDLLHVVEKIGPQDAEQNIFGQLAFGMDHAEYLTLRAPSPTLVCSAKKDFFDIEGARATVGKARAVYALFGAADALASCEADEKHGFSAPLREGAVGWMKRWLLNDRTPVPDALGEAVLRGEEAWCTPQGQVMLLPGARSVYDINRALGARLAHERDRRWRGASPEALAEEVRRITGIRALAALPGCGIERRASVACEGYRVDVGVLRPEPGIALAAYAFVPEAPTNGVTLYVDGAGKAAAAAEAAERARRGETVVALDLRGLGETQGGVLGDRDDKLGLEWKDAFAAYLLGTSYLAARAEDVLNGARAAAAYAPAGAPREVRLVAVGLAVPAALHAAALEPGLFRAVTLRRGLRAWNDVLVAPMATNQLVNAVHGALRAYDLPDLERCLPAGRLAVEEPAVLGK